MNIHTPSTAQQNFELGPAPWNRQKTPKGAVDQPPSKSVNSPACQGKAQDDVLDFQAVFSAPPIQVPLLPTEVVAERSEPEVKPMRPPSPPKTYEGYHLAPETQAQKMAENHQSLSGVRESYERMRADSSRADEEMRQRRDEVNLAISEVWTKAREKRIASQANHFEAWLQMFCKSSEF